MERLKHIIPMLYFTFFCFAIYIDTLPEPNTIKDVKVCQVNFDSQCSRHHYIKIRNCGTFFVYELTPLNSCPSAYCFGKELV